MSLIKNTEKQNKTKKCHLNVCTSYICQRLLDEKKKGLLDVIIKL